MADNITHLLIIDDDTRIRKLLGKFLSDNGFVVTAAENAAMARQKLQEFRFDLMVVDVMMPGETGIEFTAFLRKTSNVPILMLTAMGEAADRIAGLETGADDYLPKPFEPKELLLRIKSILSRSRILPKSKIIFGDMVFNPTTASLQKNGIDIPISLSEAKLLTALCNNIGTAISREELAKLCNGVSERSIDVQITRLRSKIETNPKVPVHLKTMRGRGYGLFG